MPRLVPAPLHAPHTTGDDPRVGHLLGAWLGDGRPPRAVLVGFPVDDGVRLNGGRTGAAAGPAAIRAALARLTPDAALHDGMCALLAETADLGDVAASGRLEEDQRRLGEALAPHLAAGRFVVVLGGGHETSFGHFLGWAGAERDVSIVNWDAHADVRALRDGRAHSGSPFRQALEHPSGRCRRYTVAGLLRHAVAHEHAHFVTKRGGACVWRDEMDAARVGRIYGEQDGDVMASFDLDAVDRASAPGVSAPATGGLPVDVWLRAAYLAGRTPSVRSMDVVELCPAHDRDGQTATLAALTVWWALRGVAERSAGGR
ncbi:MAG TPA: formimidoylglutamase [Gemmatimonadaceae bacterium]